jgi:hypothetical protein
MVLRDGTRVCEGGDLATGAGGGNTTEEILSVTNNSAEWRATELCIGPDCRVAWPVDTDTDTQRGNTTEEIMAAVDDGTFAKKSADESVSGTWTFADVIVNGLLMVIGNITNVNVTEISVNGSILPPTGLDNLFDLGSPSERWGSVYAGTSISSPQVCIGVDCYSSWPQRGNTTDEMAAALNNSAEWRAAAVCIGSDCRTSWPSSSGEGNTTDEILAITNNTAEWRATILCIGSDCRESWPVDTDTQRGNTTEEILGVANNTAEWRANAVCIGSDCRTAWPYGGGNTSAEIVAVTNNTAEWRTDTLCIGSDCRSAWPSTPDAFVNKTGDTMTGNLTINNQRMIVTNSTTEWHIYVDVNGTLVFEEVGA